MLLQLIIWFLPILLFLLSSFFNSLHMNLMNLWINEEEVGEIGVFAHFIVEQSHYGGHKELKRMSEFCDVSWTYRSLIPHLFTHLCLSLFCSFFYLTVGVSPSPSVLFGLLFIVFSFFIYPFSFLPSLSHTLPADDFGTSFEVGKKSPLV